MIHTYSEYKDSGVEWLGEVPTHWNKVAIKFLASEEGTLFLDGDWVESKDLSDEGIRYITTGNIGLGFYKEKGRGFISEDKFHQLNCTEVFEGDMLISRLNHPIGRACLIPNLNSRVITSVDNVIVRPNQQYSKKYLVYLFSSHEYISNTNNLARGATMQRISRGMLGNIRILLPNSLEEQEKIASYLDVKVTRIDNLIFEKENFIKLLKEKHQALVNHLVTKGLNANVTMKGSGVEWIGEIPAHWEIKNLKFYFKESFKNGIFKKSEDFGTGNKLINVSDIFTPDNLVNLDELGRIRVTEKEIKKYKAHYGDMFFVRSSLKEEGIAKSVCYLSGDDSVVFECHVVKGSPNLNTCDPKYLIRLLNSKGLRFEHLKRSTTATMTTISQRGLSETPVPSPPLSEQIEISKILDRELSIVSSLEKEVINSIELLKEHRTALISAAVTGKIDVREVA